MVPARRRSEATAAIRLLSLCESAEDELMVGEPQQEVALAFQRRLRKLLTRTDRKLLEGLDNSCRKERLAAFRAVALIGQALDDDASAEAVEVAVHEAWDKFVEETKRLEEEFVSALQVRLEEAALELERLESGPLAGALRDVASELDAANLEAPDAPAGAGAGVAKELLDAAQRAAKLLRGLRVAVKGKGVNVGVVADVGLEILQWVNDARTAEAIIAATEQVRSAYSTIAGESIERWEDYLDELRDQTTRSALNRTDAAEQELFGELADLRSDLAALVAARKELSSQIDVAIAKGYLEAE